MNQKGGNEHLALKAEVVIRLCTPVRDKPSRSAWLGVSFRDFTFTRDLETNVLVVKSPFLRKNPNRGPPERVMRA